MSSNTELPKITATVQKVLQDLPLGYVHGAFKCFGEFIDAFVCTALYVSHLWRRTENSLMADHREERSEERMGASEQESISIGSEKAPFSDARRGVRAVRSFPMLLHQTSTSLPAVLHDSWLQLK